jgi:hypothetical protein
MLFHHIGPKLLSIDFPPKGFQHSHCFVYDIKPDCQILPIAPSKLQQVEEMYSKILKERVVMEEENDRKGDKQIVL